MDGQTPGTNGKNELNNRAFEPSYVTNSHPYRFPEQQLYQQEKADTQHEYDPATLIQMQQRQLYLIQQMGAVSQQQQYLTNLAMH